MGGWNQADWVDSLPILKDNLISYYNRGNLLLLKVKCNSKNEKGLQTKQNVLRTLNNIPLNPESTFYYLILAFNLATNEFLGYPNISFIKTN